MFTFVNDYVGDWGGETIGRNVKILRRGLWIDSNCIQVLVTARQDVCCRAALLQLENKIWKGILCVVAMFGRPGSSARSCSRPGCRIGLFIGGSRYLYISYLQAVTSDCSIYMTGVTSPWLFIFFSQTNFAPTAKYQIYFVVSFYLRRILIFVMLAILYSDFYMWNIVQIEMFIIFLIVN